MDSHKEMGPREPISRRTYALEDLPLQPGEMEDCKALEARVAGARADQYVRFLRARKGKLDEAEEFLRAHLQWRSDNLPIPQEEVRPELEKLKYCPMGKDKDGRHVVVIRVRLMGADTYGDIREVERSVSYLGEALEQYVLGPIEKITVVLSRKDAGKPDKEWLRCIGKVLQDNYPERLYTALVAPVPMFFRGVWNVLKYLLDPVTREKVKLLASPEQFREYVDESELPIEFGGKSATEFNVLPWFPTLVDDENCGEGGGVDGEKT